MNPTHSTSTRRLPGEEEILTPSTTPTATTAPVIFTQEDGRSVITCSYDYQGRRFEKKVTVNGQYPAIAGSCTGTICR